MMKSKIVRGIINGGVLAAVAALGITVYQLGTKPVTESPEDSVQMEETGLKAEISDGEAAQEAEATGSGNGTVTDDDMVKHAADDMADSSKTKAGNTTAEAASGADSSTAEAAANTDGSNRIADADASSTGTDSAETSAAGIAVQNLNFTENSLMEWPVRGTVLIDYNMNETVYYPTLDQYRVSPAISVQAVEGAPVYAAADGQVLSIEQDACTGTTVTMELGNGYQAVYGQLKEISVAEGDTVKEGEVIGNVSEPTKYYSVEGPNLYFAVKKDGNPVDPFEYLE